MESACSKVFSASLCANVSCSNSALKITVSTSFWLSPSTSLFFTWSDASSKTERAASIFLFMNREKASWYNVSVLERSLSLNFWSSALIQFSRSVFCFWSCCSSACIRHRSASDNRSVFSLSISRWYTKLMCSFFSFVNCSMNVVKAIVVVWPDSSWRIRLLSSVMWIWFHLQSIGINVLQFGGLEYLDCSLL